LYAVFTVELTNSCLEYGNKFVVTIGWKKCESSNFGYNRNIAKSGVKVHQTPILDKFIYETVRDKGTSTLKEKNEDTKRVIRRPKSKDKTIQWPMIVSRL
jgi:hypothetical protein